LDRLISQIIPEAKLAFLPPAPPRGEGRELYASAGHFFPESPTTPWFCLKRYPGGVRQAWKTSGSGSPGVQKKYLNDLI